MYVDRHGLFKVGQNIILLNGSKEILIVQEKGSKWDFPGGRLHEGEDWEAGLRREIKEELDFDEFNVESIYSVRTWQADVPHYTVTFLGKIEGGVQINLNKNEVEDFAWVSLQNIDNFDYQNEGIKRDLKYILESYA